MTVQERHSDILAALDARLVAETLDTLRLEARLRELVSDAIERAPATATWASGRIAVGRLPVEWPVRADTDMWAVSLRAATGRLPA